MADQLDFGFDDQAAPPADGALARDRDAREHAVNPAEHVALEASAGTGKTRVLVDRYVNLLRAGVEPRHILAITFTRKAAAEMRARVLAELTRMAEAGTMPPEVWKHLRGRLGEIAISTIDAFCLSLLGEFPLEADVDPGFGVADETETPRLMDEALDRALRIGRVQSAHDPDVAWLFARLGEGRLRGALVRLLDRRLVALAVLDRFLSRAPHDLTSAAVAARTVARLGDLVGGGRLSRFIATGPDAGDFRLLADTLAGVLEPSAAPDAGLVADALERLQAYCCTKSGTPRRRLAHVKAAFPSAAAFQAHGALVAEFGGALPGLVDAHRREANVVLARGLRWLAARAIEQYRRTLDEHAMVDFTDALARALALLEQMEEFSQSRYRLEARYQHVLVDELQDTSRAQWALVELLVRAWGAGAGVSHEGPVPPSLFVVGDRKQSIYGFRDAEVGVLEEAARLIGRLRPGREARRAIVQSFRAVPALQQFVNDVCDEVEKRADRTDAFRYSDIDRFPVTDADPRQRPVGLVVGPDATSCARATAREIQRMLAAGETVRDRDTGVPRQIAPGDVAILFRSRDSHREYERELEAVGVSYYVYKGLGFFDADEVKDVLALIGFLAEPASDRHAAAFLRSRFVRVSDKGLATLAPRLAAALTSDEAPAALDLLDPEDRRVVTLARRSARAWVSRADRWPPADLVDAVLHDSAYAAELRGAGHAQARENLKKLRGLVRRLQNRGYATLGRIAGRLSQLMAGDESNAIVDAADAVNLMTVHAAKGLEFPVVFVVNLARGAGGRGDAVDVVTRAAADGGAEELVSIDALVGDARQEIEAREREETKRLVYVAMTRARDRLYLSTTLSRQGAFTPAGTALGHVLPATLGAVFQVAAAGGPWVDWVAASGRTHVCRVVAFEDAPAIVRPAPATVETADDFGPLTVGPPPPLAASDVARSDEAPPVPAGPPRDRDRARALGELVHAAVAGGALSASPEDRPAILQRLGAEAAPDLIAAAGAALDRTAAREDVRELMSQPDVRHEVPVSWTDSAGRTVRAVVDAVVRHADGRLTVVEFKTGAARASDERQVTAYVEGIRRLVPATPVAGQVIRIDV
ncbi:MAG: UvrD-helicase domain-containing protein [Vicinamibacterales bacterium]